MSETLYHVDRHGVLEPGDSMELTWPSQLHNRTPVFSGPRNQRALEGLFPEGLSAHGARYAHASLVAKGDTEVDGSWEVMGGTVYTSTADGETREAVVEPYAVQYEIFLELFRRNNFEDEPSRFQSYFGFDDLETARSFRMGSREGTGRIVEVAPSDHCLKDMTLTTPSHLAEVFGHGHRYWAGETWGDDPTWEAVLEPPVEVVDLVDDP